MDIKRLFWLLLAFSAGCSSKAGKKNPLSFIVPDYPATKTSVAITQTIDLEYTGLSCACAHWATPTNVDRYRDSERLAGHSLFIEAADRAQEVPDTLARPGNLIRFTGEFSREKKDGARVFVYSAFDPLPGRHPEPATEQSSPPH